MARSSLFEMEVHSSASGETHVERIIWAWKVPAGLKAKVTSSASPIDPETYRKVRLPRFA